MNKLEHGNNDILTYFDLQLQTEISSRQELVMTPHTQSEKEVVIG
jgi:hypothetical protein